MTRDLELIRAFSSKVIEISGEGIQAEHVEGALLAATAMAMALNISPAEFVSKIKEVLHEAMAIQAMDALPREMN